MDAVARAVCRKAGRMRYLSILFSVISGGLVVYGFENERMWYIVGLAFITGATKLMMQEGWKNE